MEYFEKDVLENSDLKPKNWLRYVDDTFVLWPHSLEELEQFHQYLNKRNVSIQFTIEHQKNNSLPFLDVLVQKQMNNFKTKIHRKKTHTNR